jgi:hypothetical protein
MRAAELLFEEPTEKVVVATWDSSSYQQSAGITSTYSSSVNKEAAKKVAEYIKTRCKKWFAEAKHPEDVFYRGTLDYDMHIDDVAAFVRSPREDRRPRDTGNALHKIFQQALRESGAVATRENSLFCLPNEQSAGSYGIEDSSGFDPIVWVVIPLYDFNYTWNKNAEDWTQTYSDLIEKCQTSWLVDEANKLKELYLEPGQDLSEAEAAMRDLMGKINEVELNLSMYDEEDDTSLEKLEDILQELRYEEKSIRYDIINAQQELEAIDNEHKEAMKLGSSVYHDDIPINHPIMKRAVAKVKEDIMVDNGLSLCAELEHELMVRAGSVLHIRSTFYDGWVKDALRGEA